jgi:hypothetical protein
MATAVVAPSRTAAKVKASTGVTKTGDAMRVTNTMAVASFFMS